MASVATAVTAETPITLKIHHLGATKKVKVRLGELIASTLEDNLRVLLAIDPLARCRFERYSDSAGTFVVLDRNNPAVYKQLYRAAKAKQKLKLRVIMTDPPAAIPRPVTIEDVPETAAADVPATVSSSMAGTGEDRQPYPAIPGRFPATDELPDAWSSMDARLARTIDYMSRNHELLERDIARIGASVAQMGLNSTPASPVAAAVKNVANETASSVSAVASAAASMAASVSAPASVALAASTASAAPAAPQPIPVVKCTMRNPSARQCPPSTEPVELKLSLSPPSPLHAGFSVCCNSCERTIPDAHFHCSSCEDGDFDLCQNCVDLGITCYNSDHWMIKRSIKDGAIVNSTTVRVPTKTKSAADLAKATADCERVRSVVMSMQRDMMERLQARKGNPLARAIKPKTPTRAPAPPGLTSSLTDLVVEGVHFPQMRTCNNCIQELPEAMFVHCNTCFDFDLCEDCFVKNDHGHHPKHGFEPAVAGTRFDDRVRQRLAAGRGQCHDAVCDGCDTFIRGVRHKCLSCPDWDYCTRCVKDADFVHPGHRFAPIYEPLPDTNLQAARARPIHSGIYCDGPLCTGGGRPGHAIVGDRYKCAVCDDVDFCASCEASPANTHNKTHPLIKFKTQVRHVSVTTTGEDANGQGMVVMGDRCPATFCHSAAFLRACRDAPCIMNLNKVQTVVDVKPSEAASPESVVSEKVAEPVVEPVVEPVAASTEPAAEPAPSTLDALFERDSVSDGTIMQPNHVFEQTWVLRNTGSVAWPAGCCVRFVGGDYMGHVDPNHPAGIQELVSASESTISYEAVVPGEQFSFTVLLRSPSQVGRATSYWRLTSPGGIKYGDRLWCDVDVKAKEEPTEEFKEELKEELKEEPEEPKEELVEKVKEPKKAEEEPKLEGSQMIFPKLEKESPVSSVYAEARSEPAKAADAGDSFDFDWADEDSEEGFLTDDEYDILDASDEEYTAEPAKGRK